MLNTAAKLKHFFSGFGLPAYTLGGVPDLVGIPYITYPLIEPDWQSQGNMYCQVWYPKNQLESLLRKADEIIAAIGEGIIIPTPDGYIAIYPASQRAQIMQDEVTQSAYISLLINSYQKPSA